MVEKPTALQGDIFNVVEKMASNTEIPMSEDWDKEEEVGSNYHMSVEEAKLLDLYNESLQGEQDHFKIIYRINLAKVIRRVRKAANLRNASNNLWNEAK